MCEAKQTWIQLNSNSYLAKLFVVSLHAGQQLKPVLRKIGAKRFLLSHAATMVLVLRSVFNGGIPTLSDFEHVSEIPDFIDEIHENHINCNLFTAQSRNLATRSPSFQRPNVPILPPPSTS